MTTPSDTPTQDPRPGDDAATMNAAYRRLADMDPPAMRALMIDLERLAVDSSDAAAGQDSAAADARATRHAQRALAAQAAVAALEDDG